MNEENTENKKEQSQSQPNPKTIATNKDSINEQENQKPPDNAQEKKNKTTSFLERLIHIKWSMVSSILIVIITGTYAFFAYRQWGTMDRQLTIGERAWVTIDEIIYDGFKEFKIGDKITVITKLINSGNTPALKTTIIINFGFRSPPIPDPLPIKQHPGGTSIAVIGPRSKISSTHMIDIELTDERIKLANQKIMPLYIWGTVEYEDIFKQYHRTRFCVFNTLNTPVFTICPNNNTAD